jgi:C1A family cysteine protease
MKPYLPVAKAPASLDYTADMSPVRDQGEEGTCVAFAVACGMKEYQEAMDYNAAIEMSPRFLYSSCKMIDGYPDEEGTTVRTAMKVLKKRGTCRERFWPYRPHQKDGPRPGARKDAARFKEKSYARILNLPELKMSLASKGPCVCGVKVFGGMMKTRTGVVPMPRKDEAPLGGHAICLVGYSDKKKLVKFKNSWGKRWGEGGYGYLPYKYIDKFMMDAWSAVDIDDPNPLTLASVLNYTARFA